MRGLSLAAVVFFSGCSAARIAQTRETFARTFVCPVERVQAEERGKKQMIAWGCDLKAECEKPKGPCELVWTSGERVEHARRSVVGQGGCAAEQLAMEFRREGVWAQGCGRTWLCADPTLPCTEKVKPGCQDDVRWEFEQCVARAEAKGDKGRRRAWLSGNPIQRSINASVNESRAEDRCEATRDEGLRRCVERASPAAPPPGLSP